MAYEADPDMPDVGTIGGNLYDASGENSVTSGELSLQQGYGNEEVNSNPWGYDFSAAGFNDPGSFSLGNLFGYNQPTGLPTNTGSPTAGNTNSYGFSDLYNSKFGKLAMGVLGMTPVGKAVNLATGVGSMLGKGDYLGAAGRTAGVLGGLPGAVANAGIQASRGNFANAGGLAGSLAAGPLGGFVGGQVGQMASGRAGGTPGISGVQQGREGGGFNAEGLLGGLGQLYAASQANSGLKGLNANNDAVNQQMQALSTMYSPNSPYAQQLRQTLERKDAASGRRSQYGPREVQLMAALADKQAGVSDSMGRLATSSQTNQMALNAQRNKTRGQQLALVGNLAKQSGLMDMFRGGGGGGNVAPEPSYTQYPIYDTADYGGGF